MTSEEQKPLKWYPEPGIGYSVARRADGGMQIEFTDLSSSTLKHWRTFSLEHLIDSDRLTRNLYDLRYLEDISEEAIRIAVEVNNDPSVRNIRLAVVVSTTKVKAALQRIADLTTGGGVDLGIFADMDDAESWLNRPLTLLV
jgi:hypothetical protein